MIDVSYGHPLHQTLLMDEVSPELLKGRITFWKRQLKGWKTKLSEATKTRKPDDLWIECIKKQIDIYQQDIDFAKLELAKIK